VPVLIPLLLAPVPVLIPLLLALLRARDLLLPPGLRVLDQRTSPHLPQGSSSEKVSVWSVKMKKLISLLLIAVIWQCAAIAPISSCPHPASAHSAAPVSSRRRAFYAYSNHNVVSPWFALFLASSSPKPTHQSPLGNLVICIYLYCPC